MLLNGINHIALISKDIDRLRAFYTNVFDAEVGPTKPHGDDGGETMTMIRIGPVASESWCKSTGRFAASPSAYGLRNSGDRPARCCR